VKSSGSPSALSFRRTGIGRKTTSSRGFGEGNASIISRPCAAHLPSVIEAAIATVEHAAEAKGLTIERQLDDTIGPIEAGELVATVASFAGFVRLDRSDRDS
jgi:hypothetical protein